MDDTTAWERRSGANGDPFNCVFKPDKISFSNDGVLKLFLSKGECAEYRTVKKYSFGFFEVRMRIASGSGLMAGSFFLYTGTYGKPNHHETDIEGKGKDCSIQLNHYGQGKGNHELVLTHDRLGFDPCADFHNYGFKWAQDSITYYIDEKEVHRVTTDIPSQPGQIMTNIWAGTKTVDGWLGAYTPGKTYTTQYDWVRYAPLTAESQPASPPTTASTPLTARPLAPSTASVASVNVLPIKTIQQNNYAYNGGALREENGVYYFSASGSRDPGFGIITGNAPLAGRKTVHFKVRGSVANQENGARLITQVYSDKNNASHPAITYDPVNVTSDWTEVVIFLGNEVEKAQKLQWQLNSNNGSCQIEVKNIRFE
ncbi:MAG: family 16 glycosylhydrolase [Candidatus Margulisbacteria bacterium]|nr:family 16 glycosylhydrolase [Candidatus Margulisiibacteriota bacterium]